MEPIPCFYSELKDLIIKWKVHELLSIDETTLTNYISDNISNLEQALEER